MDREELQKNFIKYKDEINNDFSKIIDKYDEIYSHMCDTLLNDFFGISEENFREISILRQIYASILDICNNSSEIYLFPNNGLNGYSLVIREISSSTGHCYSAIISRLKFDNTSLGLLRRFDLLGGPENYPDKGFMCTVDALASFIKDSYLKNNDKYLPKVTQSDVLNYIYEYMIIYARYI